MKLLYLSVYIADQPEEVKKVKDLLQRAKENNAGADAPFVYLDWDNDWEVCDDVFVCDSCHQYVDETELHNAKSMGCCDCDAEFCSAQCQIEHGRKTGHDIGHDDEKEVDLRTEVGQIESERRFKKALHKDKKG